MSDDLDPTPEVEPSAETETSPDEQTDDVGALKQALEWEREKRRQAKEELRRLHEDEDARREFLTSHGYEITEDNTDDEDEYEDDDTSQSVADPRVDKLLQQQNQLASWQAQQQYRADLEKFSGERFTELDDDARDWIEVKTQRGGNSPQALEKAVKSWFDREDKYRAKVLESYKASKKAPHVSASGKAATQTPNWRDMSREEQAERMADMVRDRSA